jgi:hypothetical protein
MSLSRRWRVSKMIQKDGEMYYTTMKPRTSLSFHNGVIDRIRGGRLISFSFPHGRVWEERATRRTVGAERVAKARRGGGCTNGKGIPLSLRLRRLILPVPPSPILTIHDIPRDIKPSPPAHCNILLRGGLLGPMCESIIGIPTLLDEFLGGRASVPFF